MAYPILQAKDSFIDQRKHGYAASHSMIFVSLVCLYDRGATTACFPEAAPAFGLQSSGFVRYIVLWTTLFWQIGWANSDMSNPLHVREFFNGLWSSSGELIPIWWIRWLCPREQIRSSSEPVWLTETIWLVKDRFEFSSGRVLDGRMFCELIAPDRIHVTADHMPGGADIKLTETGFTFTPYRVVTRYRRLVVQLRCFDECTLDADGRVHDRIRIYWHGIPVAEMRLGPTD